MHMKSLRILYLVLAGVGAIAAAATAAYPDAPVIREFGGNVATESLAIIVTLAFVRTILERQERARRLRASLGALRKARSSLEVLVSTWSDLVKGCLPAMPAERPTSDEELFASHYTEHLARLDPGVTRLQSAAEGAGERWSAWAAARFRRIRDALADIARSYGAVLDPDYVEVLEALVDDPFLVSFLELVGEGADARAWRFQTNLNRGLREGHFRALVSAIAVHNRVAEEAAAYRSRSILPKAAALDIDLGVAEDLLLDTRLDPGFWAARPTPGSLRSG